MTQASGRHELSRPRFDRALRLGRRVIRQCRPEVRFGPDWSPSLRGRTLVNGVEFPNAIAAARFGLDGVIPFRGDGRRPASPLQLLGRGRGVDWGGRVRDATA